MKNVIRREETKMNFIKSLIKKVQDAMSSTIKINGNVVSGMTVAGDLCISNGRVTINGKDVTPGDAKTITIEIVGDVNKISVDACSSVKVTGSAGKVQTMSGDVECGDVTGSVETMSGDVTCKSIGGSVKTMSGEVTTR